MENNKSQEPTDISYQDFFEDSMDLLLILDTDLKIKKVNKLWTTALGWPLEELKNKKFLSFIAEEEKTKTQNELLATQKGNPSIFYETKILCEYGEAKWVRWSAWTHPQTKDLCVIIRAIDAVGTVISELERTQQMFKSIFDNIPALVYVKEPGGVYFYINKQFEDSTGASKRHVIGNCTDFDIFPTKTAQTLRTLDHEVMTNKKPMEYRQDISFNQQDMRSYQSYMFPIFDKNTTLMATGGVFIDITESKQAQEKLKDTEERMRLAITGTSAGVWDWDLTTNKLYFDEKWASILGYSISELPGVLDAWTSTVHFEDLPSVYKALNSYWDGHTPRFSVKYRGKTKSGEYKWISTEGASIHDNEGSPKRMVGWSRDITDEILLEQRLEDERANATHTSKMASLGEMAGGIAHEINNPLAIISGSASRLLSLFEKGNLSADMIRVNCDRIIKTIDRIAKIIRGLRSFARDADKDPFTSTLVSQIINETLDFCRARFHNSSIEIKVQPFSAELYVDCRSVQISQVLLNLLNNSYDAILGKENAWMQIDVTDKIDFVEISVTDSGLGIPPMIQEKIMQPFFTTKEIGKGTGLGLSISAGILKEHHGELILDKACSNTRFIMKLAKKQPSARTESMQKSA